MTFELCSLGLGLISSVFIFKPKFTR